MTLSKELQPWFRVDIVFRNIYTPSLTKTMQFTSRTAIGGGTLYFPLLISESGIGQSIGQDGIPDSPSGTITLDDSAGNFGEHRSISDLFERFTIINQDVTLFWAQTGLENTNIPFPWTQYWKGRVVSWEKTCTGDEQLSIAVSTVSPEIKYLHKIITEDMAASEYSVPESSLGKTLPIVFCDSSLSSLTAVPAVSLDYSVTKKDAARYAYSIGLHTQFTQGAVATVYAKDTEDTYRLVKPKNLYTSANLQTTTAGAAGQATSHAKTEFLSPLRSLLNQAIVTGARWYVQAQNNGAISPTGKIVFTLYKRIGSLQEFSLSTVTWEAVTTTEVLKVDYTSEIRANTDFYVDAIFPEAVAVTKTERDNAGFNYFGGEPNIWAIGIVQTEHTGNVTYGTATADFTSAKVETKTAGVEYYTKISDAGGWLLATGNFVPLVVTEVADWSSLSSATDSDGFTCRFLNLTQEVRNTKKCDMQGLELMVTDSGIRDDGAGTISGVANAVISRPQHILKTVSRQWNGTSWVANNDYDFSAYTTEQGVYTTGRNQRAMAGYVPGGPTLDDYINILVRESASYLVPLNNGKLGLLPWGARLAVQKVFTDENCSVLTFRQLDIGAVVNSTTITYAKNSINIDNNFILTGAGENASRVLVAQQGIEVSSNTTSLKLYGNRPLDYRDTQLIADASTATSYANYILARSDAPAFVVRIEVPFFDNTNLEIMQVVDLVSTKMPAHFGANHGSQGVTYQGNIIDIFRGRKAVRAQRYRCQIIGKLTERDRGVSPRLILDLRVVKPFNSADLTCDDIHLLGT